MRLQGKNGIVTGGAKGIGYATAMRLVKEGCAVCLWDLDAEGLEAARVELVKNGGTVFTRVCDVGDAEAVAACYGETVREMGDIDILINNAGILRDGEFLSREVADWDATIRINLNSIVYTTHAVLKRMYERNTGHIVNISSAAGLVGVSDLSVYASTKWAVLGLTESLRHEAQNRKSKVRFSSVHPNFIRSGLFAGASMTGLGNIMIPRLKNHDVIAKAIVNHAVLRGKKIVMRPRTLHLAAFLRGILPYGWFLRFVRFLKVNVSMRTWTGP